MSSSFKRRAFIVHYVFLQAPPPRDTNDKIENMRAHVYIHTYIHSTAAVMYVCVHTQTAVTKKLVIFPPALRDS